MKLQRSLLASIGLFMLAGLFTVPIAEAQVGKISGRIIDARTGESLAGANVVIVERWVGGRPVQAPETIGAAADANGYYDILNVSPGTYNVRATLIGYAPLVRTDVVVNTGLTTTVDFRMIEVALEGEEVLVVANRDVIRPDISSTVEYISPTRVTQSPTTRVDEFIGMIKGVELQSTDQGHGLSVRGGSIRETDIRIDGQSLRNPRSGNSYLSFNTATVEEIQVKTGGFEARYGGFQSGLVNVVTKEGSRNRFTVNAKIDYTPAGQRRFFGTGPWEVGSPLYETYSGRYAMTGVPAEAIKRPSNPLCDDPDRPAFTCWIPDAPIFTEFRGWNVLQVGQQGLHPDEKLALWRARHPVFNVATRPDYFIEGAISGPFPLPKTTFLLGAKYEDTQFAYPLGGRDNYEDYNVQLKLTTRFNPRTMLSLSGMYANVSTINAGSASTAGGAVVTVTDRFNFLSNTRSSVRHQAGMIAGDWGLYNLWNIGRSQFYQDRLLTSGLKLTHVLSQRTFFNLEGQFYYNDNTISPFGFSTSRPDAFLSIGSRTFLNLPKFGMPDYGVTFVDDQLGRFRLSGWAAASDSSYSWATTFRGDITHQLSRHHQLEAGFDVRYNNLYVYSGVNQSAVFGFEPSLFQYYTATPIEAALFVQDKLEYEGMVATVGLRVEYFNSMKDGFEIDHPLSPEFRDVFTGYYNTLPGAPNSYERWLEWRKILDAPPGWPVKPSTGKLRFAPRIGTSFPITTASKMYFNYGMAYQSPHVPFLYNQVIGGARTTIPNPDLAPEKTTAFEFGYEQSLMNNYLFNVTFYYKDVQNRALPVTFLSYYEDNLVRTYRNDGFRDIRGIELRFEKNLGRFFTFWANYDYQVVANGQRGFATIYEDQLKASLQERSPISYRPQPRPVAYVNLNLRTPNDFGPRVLGNYPFGGFYVNPLFEWREGGYIIWNPQESNPALQQRVDIVDFTNVDLRVSKLLNVPQGRVELLLTVQNLLNQKRLEPEFMTNAQRDSYRNSLRLPFQAEERRGTDRWGEWNRDHIDTGWYDAPIFLNPRRFIAGMRVMF
jgi:outer membrane receptor protein involved in Fe transport